MIVAGGGVTASGAEAELVRLAEMLNIPVATGLNAKGSIPENHPLSVGVVGSYSRWSANRVVSEADLVLFVGSHTGSQITLDWRIPAEGTPVIQIDIDASELGRSYPSAYITALQGDAKRTLEAMLDVLEPHGWQCKLGVPGAGTRAELAGRARAGADLQCGCLSVRSGCARS